MVNLIYHSIAEQIKKAVAPTTANIKHNKL